MFHDISEIRGTIWGTRIPQIAILWELRRIEAPLAQRVQKIPSSSTSRTPQLTHVSTAKYNVNE